jgi:BASS family bile acid:Na+ symporter
VGQGIVLILLNECSRSLFKEHGYHSPFFGIQAKYLTLVKIAVDAANVKGYDTDIRVGFAVTGFLITNIGISILLLGLLPLVTGNFTAVFMFNVFYSIMTAIIIPMVCARVVRHYFPAILRHSAKFKSLTLVLWSASLFILAAVARRNFDQNSDASLGVLGILALTAGVICAVNFTVGYFLTKSEYRRDTSQILGQKNTTFAIYLALEFSSGIAALATIFYVLFHNLWNSVQLFLHDRQKEGGGESFPGE